MLCALLFAGFLGLLMKFEQQIFGLANPNADFIADIVIQSSFALRFARVTKEQFLESLHKNNLEINAAIDAIIRDFDHSKFNIL